MSIFAFKDIADVAVIFNPLEISNIPVTINLYILLEYNVQINVDNILKITVKLNIMAKVLNVSSILATILLNRLCFLKQLLFSFFKSCCIILLGLNIIPKITEDKI